MNFEQPSTSRTQKKHRKKLHQQAETRNCLVNKSDIIIIAIYTESDPSELEGPSQIIVSHA